jgi:predicted nuclease with TOPRIM domain
MMSRTSARSYTGVADGVKIDRSEGKVMETEERKKLIAELAAERDELERKAAELDRQGQRLKDGTQKRALLLEARSLRDQAKERGRRWADLTDDELHDDERG